MVHKSKVTKYTRKCFGMKRSGNREMEAGTQKG